jgi:hypothetical protein
MVDTGITTILKRRTKNVGLEWHVFMNHRIAKLHELE